MTLTQRLTRGGLAFLLFGSIVAVLPGTDTAEASTTTCSTDANTLYRLTSSASGTDSSSATIAGVGGTLPLYTFISKNAGTTFSRDPSIPVQALLGHVTLNPATATDGSGQITATRATTGADYILATFTDTAGGKESDVFTIN